MKSHPGALILGSEYQALGLLRQLHAGGVRCALVDQDRYGVARFSRFCGPFHHSPRYDDDDFWPWLVALGRNSGYEGWVLFTTDDEQVRQISLHHDEACRMFRYAGPEWSAYQWLYDKRANYEWCGRNGVTTPRSFLPQDRDDITGPELPFPFIVKPAYKRNYSRHCKAKAIRVESAADLKAALDGTLREVSVSELLYQEIIPGDGNWQWSYAGLFSKGQPVAAFTACRRRQHPPDFGRASTFVVAQHDPEVERESRHVLEASNYTGLAEVEWKRDPRDGRLKFLEVNARCWGWHSLASKVIGNIPMMLMDLLSDREVAPVAPRYGWSWVKHVTDMPVVVDLWRRRELGFGDYVKSLSGQVVGCEWSREDPWPFLLQFVLVPYLMVKRGY